MVQLGAVHKIYAVQHRCEKWTACWAYPERRGLAVAVVVLVLVVSGPVAERSGEPVADEVCNDRFGKSKRVDLHDMLGWRKNGWLWA